MPELPEVESIKRSLSSNIVGQKLKNYKIYDHPLESNFYDGFELVFEIERKSRYYVFNIILPIILILIVSLKR